MDEEEINYRFLRKIQQLERNSPTLSSLKTDFYIELSEYLEGLKLRSEKEEDSQKKMLLKDEIQNTKKIATNIYEQREKKILLAAVSKARGGNPDVNNMLLVEKELFDYTFEQMQKTRNQVFERDKCIKEEKSNERKIDTNKETKTEGKKEEKTADNTNPILLVKQNIPEFVGTDGKKYSLYKNDLISTPVDMANMLCKRGVVEKVDLYSTPKCKNMPKNQ